MVVTTLSEAEQVQRGCTRFLTHNHRLSPREQLLALAEGLDPDTEADNYGQGALINGFEAEIATLLGKETAVFMPSGTMCQQIALRLWCDRRGSPNVIMHPLNHLDRFEQYGYQRLHGLRGIPTGHPNRLLTLADLRGVAELAGALLLELPQRELGGQLPTWDELNALTGWARERGIAAHLDGARLWESQPFYDRPHAAIADLFDSVYVSFYKGLGGIAGAALAGPADLIAEARVWQHRHGGRLPRLYPYVVAAQQGLRHHLPRMAEYAAKARAVAVALAALPRVSIVPDPPQTNMMHLWLRGEQDAFLAAALDVARETGVFLTSRLAASPLPDWQIFELAVGEATLDLADAEIVALFERLFVLAGYAG